MNTEQASAEQPLVDGYTVEDFAAGAVWNDAFRLGYLLGSRAASLAQLGL